MKIGVTLGKYAPFHNGHALVIETALAEMDSVVVMVYNASHTTHIPTHVRAEWIQRQFPNVSILLAEEGPQETGYTTDIIDLQNTYIRQALEAHLASPLDALSITFYSSEPYGAHVSDALGFTNRVVDMQRLQQPISATQLRATPAKAQTHCSDAVCAYLKPRFYFMGGTSTGKTTISQYAARQLGGNYCREYGREYWFAHQQDHRLSMHDLETIAVKQQQIERQACETAHDVVCVDTNTMTTCAFAFYYFGDISDRLLKLLEDDLYRYQSPHCIHLISQDAEHGQNDNAWQNQHVFLCDDDIPFDDTWDRSGTASRTKLQALNKKLLAQYNIPYTVLSGSIHTRFQHIQEHIKDKVSWNFSTTP